MSAIITDPFAALAQAQREKDNAHTAQPSAVTPPPSPAPPLPSPVPQPAQAESEPAVSANTDDINPDEAAETEDPVTKPKRRPGRPKKVKPVIEDEIPSDARPSELAITLSADKAWVALNKKKQVLEEGVEQTREQEYKARDAAHSFGVLIENTEEEIAKLQATLEELSKKRVSAQENADAFTTQLSEQTETLSEIDETLNGVTDYLLSMTKGSPGTFGAVRITVLDGTPRIDQV